MNTFATGVVILIITTAVYAQNTFPSLGNVGIGTTNPLYRLDVNGTQNISNGFGTPNVETAYRLKFYDNGGTNNDAGIGLDGVANGGEIMWFNALNGFYFNYGTSGQKITFSPSGSVGIGTTSPGAKLDVAGVINGRNYQIPGTGGVAQWVKLGTFTAGQVGHTIRIVAYIHQGYNARNDQDGVYTIIFKTSNSNSTDANGFYGNGSWYEIGNSAALPPGSFKWKANSSYTSFDLYVNLPVFTENSHYTVSIPDSASWTHAGTLGQTDPGPGSSTILVPSVDFNIPVGNVGIGTTNPTEKLSVNGRIRAKEVVVETTNWSDYVLAKDHKLTPLSEVEQHIENEGHLPGVPSAKEVADKGVSLGDMQAILLAKIEELTLHQIQQEKSIGALQSEVQSLKAENAQLRSQHQ